MGLFDSKYKSTGGIANQQLVPQRKFSDTYFGELVIKNTRDGESVADNIRGDIMSGNTARLRQFNKKGDKYGFSANFIFESPVNSIDISARISSITGRPVNSISGGSWRNVGGREIFIAGFSGSTNPLHGNLHFENHQSLGVACIGRFTVGGIEKSFKTMADANIVMVFTFADGTTYAPIIPSNIASETGYYTHYKSGNRTYYFFSTDQYFNGTATTNIIASEIYPIISLQDNWNNEYPYETLPHGDTRYIAREKTMKRLGMDFEAISRQIFSHIPNYKSAEWNATYGNQFNNTPNLKLKYSNEWTYYNELIDEMAIPAINSQEWRSYKNVWIGKKKECTKKTANPSYELLDGDAKFCTDYPTEAAYHAGLVSDKKKAGDSTKNITDVHFGIFATVKTLKEANIAALYYTLEPMLRLMNRSPVTVVDDSSNYLDENYNYDSLIFNLNEFGTGDYNMRIKAGSFDVRYEMTDWSLCRRYGIADPIRYPSGVKSAKYKHTSRKIYEDHGPTWTTGGAIDTTFAGTRAPSKTGDSCLQLRVQDRASSTGAARFLEMRLYGLRAQHIVDVIRDGEHGKSGHVLISGGLKGFYSHSDAEPYSDVIMFPISINSAKEVPIFRRERLIRECAIVRVGTIAIQEVKWYQQGWFKIVMIIVSVIISAIYAPAGAMMLTALKTIAMIAVLYVASAVIDNPLLLAIIQIAAIAFGGFNGGSFDINPAMLVEAAGVAIQTKIAMDVIALQEEMKAWRKMVNEKQEEFDKMKEEVGLEDFNAEWMLYVAGLTPHEEPEEFFERTLKSELPSLEIKEVEVESKLPSRK